MNKFRPLSNRSGFTLVEMLLTVSIFSLLFGFATINLTGSQQRASINTTIQTIISDLKNQQIRAMVGDVGDGSDVGPYGLHFDEDQYVLFFGETYSSTDSANFEIPLSENIEFTTLTDIIFSEKEGELSSPSSITIRDKNVGQEKTIQLNRYGVVTGVN